MISSGIGITTGHVRFFFKVWFNFCQCCWEISLSSNRSPELFWVSASQPPTMTTPLSSGDVIIVEPLSLCGNFGPKRVKNFQKNLIFIEILEDIYWLLRLSSQPIIRLQNSKKFTNEAKIFLKWILKFDKCNTNHTCFPTFLRRI